MWGGVGIGSGGPPGDAGGGGVAEVGVGLGSGAGARVEGGAAWNDGAGGGVISGEALGDALGEAGDVARGSTGLVVGDGLASSADGDGDGGSEGPSFRAPSTSDPTRGPPTPIATARISAAAANSAGVSPVDPPSPSRLANRLALASSNRRGGGA